MRTSNRKTRIEATNCQLWMVLSPSRLGYTPGNILPTATYAINKMEAHHKGEIWFVSPGCTVAGHLESNHLELCTPKRGAIHFDSTPTFDFVPCAADATLNASQRAQPGATHNVGETWLYTLQPVPDVLHSCLSHLAKKGRNPCVKLPPPRTSQPTMRKPFQGTSHRFI